MDLCGLCGRVIKTISKKLDKIKTFLSLLILLEQVFSNWITGCPSLWWKFGVKIQNPIQQILCLTLLLEFNDNYVCLDKNRNFSKCSPFEWLHKALHCRRKELTSKDVGLTVKRADPICANDEIVFWNSGMFHMNTSKGLSFAVFFCNCIYIGLHGNTKHKNLDASQFVVRSS